MGWAVKPHLRWMLNRNDSLVLFGSYASLGLNTDHRLQGSFGGTGLSAMQLAGYDHVDASQELAVRPWQALAGLVHSFDNARSLVVLGVGAEGESGSVLNRSWQIRGTPSSFNDLVPLRRHETRTEKLQVPVLMGAEVALRPWVKARGMVTRNFFRSDRSTVSDEAYSNTGALSSRKKSDSSDSVGPDWKAVLGFGLDFGAFKWDLAVNSGLLGSASGAAFVNPLYQSSFAFAW